MRKYISFLLVLIISSNSLPSLALDGVVRFNEKKELFVLLEVAVTDEERQKGLMYRTELDENKGMVFIFRPAQKATFWMKNTFIPLDIIFINNGKIVKIVENAEPNQTETVYPSEFEVTEVIEVVGGYTKKHDIKVDDTVTFENIAEIDYSTEPALRINKK